MNDGKENAELRRHRQEQKRDPAKYRVAHERGRNVKNPRLSDLNNRELTTDDVQSLTRALHTENDRGAALLYAALVENGVQWAIYRRMPDLGPQMKTKTFYGEKAPLGTFSAKITMGRAMGIYGPETERLLNGIREIRNIFAHSLFALDFNTPEIAVACNVLDVPGGLRPQDDRDTPRNRFALASNWVFMQLMDNAIGQTRRFVVDLP